MITGATAGKFLSGGFVFRPTEAEVVLPPLGGCFTTIGRLIVFRQKLIFRPTEAEVFLPTEKNACKPLGPQLGPGQL